MVYFLEVGIFLIWDHFSTSIDQSIHPSMSHLHPSFVQRSGPVGDPGASFQCGSNKGVMLPALKLPEGAEIRVAVVQTHLEEREHKGPIS